MSAQFSYQQVSSTYINFPSQGNIFFPSPEQENTFSPGPSQMFGTSRMTPPFAFHPTPTMHCYRPTMRSMGSEIPSDDNEEENNDDENPPSFRRLPRQRRRPHVE